MTVEKAIMLASKAHEGQVDRGGSPYILHPLAVMMKMTEEKEKIVAVLHDVVEDTDLTLEDLTKEGFTGEIVEAIELLTRKKGEKYWDYIKRISTSKLASTVKMEDLKENMDLSRLKRITEKDMDRYERYKACFGYLSRRHGFRPVK